MASAQPITPYWQFAFGRPGEAVTGLDEIAQCISLIVQTPLGSLPGQPELGCDVISQLDRPVTTAIPRMIQSVFQALRMWEPRIDVLRVSVSPVRLGAVILSVVWVPKGSPNVSGGEISQLILLGSAA
jgi:phage baseplate assembly protein W